MQLLPLLALAIAASAQDQTTLSMKGCVDDNAMASCQNAADTQLSNCLAQSGNAKTEVLACGCEHYIQNINCAASACWNRVYECNYQGYVTWYLANCPTAKTPVPYFPIPDGAPDACSCNLGAVYLAISHAWQESTACSNQAHGGDAVSEVYAQQACVCCGLSSALTSMYTTCPTTDPHLIGLNRILDEQRALNQPWAGCGNALSRYNCVSGLGFAQVGNGLYLPSNTPDADAITGQLSNTGGVVEAPGEGASFTYTAGDGQSYTITAMSAGGGSGNSGGAAGSSGGSSSVDAGSPSSSGSGTTSSQAAGGGSASSSTKKSAGEKTSVNRASVIALSVVALCHTLSVLS